VGIFLALHDAVPQHNLVHLRVATGSLGIRE
jgi:hypothetical protein